MNIQSVHFHLPGNHLFIVKNLVLIIIFSFFSSLQNIEAMRVHPMTTKDFNPPQIEGNSHKKLKKLPHVFSKVLELPFGSDADVAVEEGADFFRFVVEIEVVGQDVSASDVRAHAVEIHPGVIKIVVRNDHGPMRSDMDLSLDKLEVDTWRYRLPPSSLPEMATAMFADGALVVTVPKGGGMREFVDGTMDGWGSGNLVLVQ